MRSDNRVEKLHSSSISQSCIPQSSGGPGARSSRTAIHALRRRGLLVLALASLAIPSWARELELDFMDVGQGDGAVLISPGGEVVLFDDGRYKACDKPLHYLRRLGIDHVDYLIVSHYHSDHIGCTKEVLKEFPLKKAAYDRGGSYPGAVFADYVKAVGGLRHTGTKGQVITLDAGSPKPVKIQVTALDGNGVQTTNENDLSLDAVVHYGDFDAELGGDLSGVATADYLDIESGVAPLVGQVEIYDAHHHCSRYSTNGTWLDVTRPKVGIVSAGNGNTYQHPTAECVERLHEAGVQLYWTERGNGVEPDPSLDSVCGNIAVTVGPADRFFSWPVETQSRRRSRSGAARQHRQQKKLRQGHRQRWNMHGAARVRCTTTPSARR